MIKVNANAHAALGAKHVVAGFGVELVAPYARVGVVVPFDLLVRWIWNTYEQCENLQCNSK